MFIVLNRCVIRKGEWMLYEKCIGIRFSIFIFDTYDSDASDFIINREV